MINLEVGVRLGHLTITEVRATQFVCRCDCGASVTRSLRNLRAKDRGEPMCKACRKLDRKSFRIRFVGVKECVALVERALGEPAE